ncbi:hypothetical protein C3L33_18092, partial [Rhododendron williamsianum]
MEETTIEEHGRSLAAPIIFTIVVAFQLLSRFIEHKKKNQGVTEETKIEEHGRSLAVPVVFMIVFTFQSLSRFLEHEKKHNVTYLILYFFGSLLFSQKGSKSGWRTNCAERLSKCIRRPAPCHIIMPVGRPSTFAQAAKLRRMAASKEKDLAKSTKFLVVIMKASDPPPLQAEYTIKLKMDRVFLNVCFEGIKYLAGFRGLLGSEGRERFVARGGSDGNVEKASSLKFYEYGCVVQELHSKEMKLSYDSYSKGLTILKVFTFFSLVCWFWRLPVAAISKQLVEPFGKVLSWRGGSPPNDNVMVIKHFPFFFWYYSLALLLDKCFKR